MKIISAIGVATICMALSACSEQGELGSHYMSGTTVQELPEGEMLVSCMAGIGGCYSRMTAHCPDGFNEIERISKPTTGFQNSNDTIRFKCK